jgi:hypothetical protein
MSTAEMKLVAIQKLTVLESDSVVRQILDLLDSAEKSTEKKDLNLSKHYDSVAGKYGSVLAKLAQ